MIDAMWLNKRCLLDGKIKHKLILIILQTTAWTHTQWLTICFIAGFVHKQCTQSWRYVMEHKTHLPTSAKPLPLSIMAQLCGKWQIKPSDVGSWGAMDLVVNPAISVWSLTWRFVDKFKLWAFIFDVDDNNNGRLWIRYRRNYWNCDEVCIPCNHFHNSTLLQFITQC